MGKPNTIFNLIGSDGMKHIILSAILTVVVKWLLPVWVAVGVVLSIGIAKEVYDKVGEKGCCEWKDIICDLIGIAIGVL
jgi:hypothetical protein